eukprot:CAMPEP_0171693772 /NCGR_PEP_ID=MMETSP0991-20121206/6844_1 /TAXON_ID=483369 /ORGANISM="non described non described, Strain CCMP2098" /LENGTH=40 /DNA_ID= /DNA_START= /DNA_END= /DNA_ORIENTATION=
MGGWARRDTVGGGGANDKTSDVSAQAWLPGGDGGEVGVVR